MKKNIVDKMQTLKLTYIIAGISYIQGGRGGGDVF